MCGTRLQACSLAIRSCSAHLWNIAPSLMAGRSAFRCTSSRAATTCRRQPSSSAILCAAFVLGEKQSWRLAGGATLSSVGCARSSCESLWRDFEAPPPLEGPPSKGEECEGDEPLKERSQAIRGRYSWQNWERMTV